MLKYDPNGRANIKELKELISSCLSESANFLKKEKDFNGTQNYLYKLMEVNPNNAIAHMAQALVYVEKNDLARAKILYQQTLSIDPFFTNPIFYKNDLPIYKKLLEHIVLKGYDKDLKRTKDLMTKLENYRKITSSLSTNDSIQVTYL